MIRHLTKHFGNTFWILAAALLLTVLVMMTVPIGADGYDDYTTTVVLMICIILGLAGAAAIRYLFAKPTKESQETDGRAWGLLWTFPLFITAAMSPWLLSGLLVADDMSVAVSIGLWLLIAYVALLVGFLLVPFVIVPLEMIGVGLLRIMAGRFEEGSRMVAIGLYIALVTAFCVIGGLAISDTPPGQAGWPHVIFALFGLPANYSVESPLLLWIARILGIIIVAIPLAIAVPGRLRK